MLQSPCAIRVVGLSLILIPYHRLTQFLHSLYPLSDDDDVGKESREKEIQGLRLEILSRVSGHPISLLSCYRDKYATCVY